MDTESEIIQRFRGGQMLCVRIQDIGESVIVDKQRVYICQKQKKNENADHNYIDLLLEKGGDINAILCEGDTCTSPLRCAAQMGNFTLFMYLLDKGADLAKKLPYDQYDGNILNAAVLGGNLDIVKYIISKGFDIHYSEKHLKRSLLASAMNSDSLGVLEVIDYLVKAGLDVNYKDAYKKTVFYYVWVSEDETKEEKNIKAKVLLRILDKGLRVNTTDEVGNTPLHYACELGFSDVVAALLKKNAKVNAQNEQGETPLDIARKKGNPDIIRMLEVATKK
ncbi:MAG: ankyrin repeat domain-containing protein [Desulfovibrionaceae bacterium]|nr:ankyrin repeat domain-containing protein [Desulfovibrionaceae bacterium]